MKIFPKKLPLYGFAIGAVAPVVLFLISESLFEVAFFVPIVFLCGFTSPGVLPLFICESDILGMFVLALLTGICFGALAAILEGAWTYVKFIKKKKLSYWLIVLPVVLLVGVYFLLFAKASFYAFDKESGEAITNRSIRLQYLPFCANSPCDPGELFVARTDYEGMFEINWRYAGKLKDESDKGVYAWRILIGGESMNYETVDNRIYLEAYPRE